MVMPLDSLHVSSAPTCCCVPFLCACLMFPSSRTLLHYRWFKFFFQIIWKMLNSSRITAARLHSLRCNHSLFSALSIPSITNEPFLHYAPGSLERRRVLEACKSAREECPEIPLVINGKTVRTGDIGRQVSNCCANWGFPPPTPPPTHTHLQFVCRLCPVSTATLSVHFTALQLLRFA